MTTSDPRDLDRLVASSLAGERGAMDRLLRILRPLVVRYCRTRLGGYDRVTTTADDVAQEVCLAVLRALPTYQDQGRPFLAFVYGIAQHKVVDAHRSAGRNRSPLNIPDSPAALDESDSIQPDDLPLEVTSELAGLSADSDMSELLAKLPAKQREVLRLRIVIGLTAEETAEIVGATPGAVRVAQHRAMSKLHKMIEELDHSNRDWDAAPVTGFGDLDDLLHAADANLQRRLPEDSRGPSIYLERDRTNESSESLTARKRDRRPSA